MSTTSDSKVYGWKPTENFPYVKEGKPQLCDVEKAVNWCYQHGATVHFAKQQSGGHQAVQVDIPGGYSQAGYGFVQVVESIQRWMRHAKQNQNELKIKVSADTGQSTEEIGAVRKEIEHTIAASEKLQHSLGNLRKMLGKE